MTRALAVDINSAPLFWLELFDQGTARCIDSFSCYKIKDAVPVLQEFMAQANDLSNSDEAPE